jgi:3-hydroxyacyl-CoA dehydrogenase
MRIAMVGYEVSDLGSLLEAADAARSTACAQLTELSQAGLLDERPDAVLARVSIATSLQATFETADHVQENRPERRRSTSPFY